MSSDAQNLSAALPQSSQEPTRKQLLAENVELRARLAELEALLHTTPATPHVEGAWVLKTALRYSGRLYPAGDLLPFDPADPPEGCDGLTEGVHYEHARVLTRAS